MCQAKFLIARGHLNQNTSTLGKVANVNKTDC